MKYSTRKNRINIVPLGLLLGLVLAALTGGLGDVERFFYVILILGILGVIIYWVVYFARKTNAPEPDEIIKKTTTIFGETITTTFDPKTGATEIRVRDRGGRLTSVYITKKCFKCGADVRRSGDGRFHCCSRRFR